MKRFFALLLTAVAMLAMMVPAPAHAEPLPVCSVQLLSSTALLKVTCTDGSGNVIAPGQLDLNLLDGVLQISVKSIPQTIEIPVPGPTVTVTPAPVTVTQTVQATETVRPAPVEKTVSVPSPTKTVLVEGPTRTVTRTVTVSPENRTVTVNPRPVVVTRSAAPVPAVTLTTTPSPTTGQIIPKDGTVEDGDKGFFRIDVADDGEVTAAETGIGLLSAVLIFLTVLYAMYFAYGRGQRDAVNNETRFLRGVLDRSKVSR